MLVLFQGQISSVLDYRIGYVGVAMRLAVGGSNRDSTYGFLRSIRVLGTTKICFGTDMTTYRLCNCPK